ELPLLNPPALANPSLFAALPSCQMGPTPRTLGVKIDGILRRPPFEEGSTGGLLDEGSQMEKRKVVCGLLAASLLGLSAASGQSAGFARLFYAQSSVGQIQLFRGGRGGPGWGGGRGWRGGPGWRGPWRGPPGWAGRPYWFARPWVRRPYYGTIIAGVALGTLITVAAVGAVPPRPAANLFWYWADPAGRRGYWDYC